MLDLDKITDAMVVHTMKAVATATAPLLSRIEALEGQVKAVADRPIGVPAEKAAADLEELEARMIVLCEDSLEKARRAAQEVVTEYSQPDPLPDIAGIVAEAVAAMPVPRDGEDGKSVSVDDVAPIIRDEIAKAMESVKAPELPDIAVMVGNEVKAAVEALPVPQDGKDGSSVSVDDVLPALQGLVKLHLDAIPAPLDGKDGKDGEAGKDGTAGAPGRDGLDVKDLFRADGGRLVAVMSDGTTKDLGMFVGKDGGPGRDGVNGKDGSDGLGFEDLAFETDEHGRVIAKFQRGDLVKSARLPGIVDRGPFKAGDGYEKGDAVSYGGSLWIAQEPTSDKPDGSKAWRLAVKKGRDARVA